MKLENRKLPMEYYSSDAVTLAKSLLGKVLVTVKDGVRTAGIISETEAYMGVIDRASHAYGGRRTERTETMYLPGGHAYVYLIYGMYYCMNVVASCRDNPEAVLIRGVVPILGTDVMASRRLQGKAPSKSKMKHLSDGPGKLCTALAIDKSFDKELLVGDRIYICDTGVKLSSEAVASKRINIDYAGEDVHKLWRFSISGNDPVLKMTEAQT